MFGFPTVPTPLPAQVDDAAAAGVTYHIGGALVPVLTIELQAGQSAYFEHHILLWKEPSVSFQIRPMGGMIKRLIAGMELFIVEAVGPGRIAFSRDAVGQVFPVILAPGQALHVREHQFLAATSGVDFTWERQQGISNMLFGGTGFFVDRFMGGANGGVVWLHGHGNVFEKILASGEQFDIEPGGWLCKDPQVGMETFYQGLTAGFLGGMRLACNRFTGPGRVALQSMSSGIEGSAAEGTAQNAQQTAAGSAWNVIGGLASGLLRTRD